VRKTGPIGDQRPKKIDQSPRQAADSQRVHGSAWREIGAPQGPNIRSKQGSLGSQDQDAVRWNALHQKMAQPSRTNDGFAGAGRSLKKKRVTLDGTLRQGLLFLSEVNRLIFEWGHSLVTCD
jgi:hypothetical protein